MIENIIWLPELLTVVDETFESTVVVAVCSIKNVIIHKRIILFYSGSLLDNSSIVEMEVVVLPSVVEGGMDLSIIVSSMPIASSLLLPQ